MLTRRIAVHHIMIMLASALLIGCIADHALEMAPLSLLLAHGVAFTILLPLSLIILLAAIQVLKLRNNLFTKIMIVVAAMLLMWLSMVINFTFFKMHARTWQSEQNLIFYLGFFPALITGLCYGIYIALVLDKCHETPGKIDEACALKTRYDSGDFLFWSVFAFIPIGVAGLAAGNDGWNGIGLFVLIFSGLFMTTFFSFFCYRCPHYCNSNGVVKCKFLWGVPRLRKPKPGPYTKLETVVSFTGLALMWLFPLYWLLHAPILLFIYVLTLSRLYLAVRRYECIRCIHAGCPLCAGHGKIQA